jgi:hypothetical protein
MANLDARLSAPEAAGSLADEALREGTEKPARTLLRLGADDTGRFDLAGGARQVVRVDPDTDVMPRVMPLAGTG